MEYQPPPHITQHCSITKAAASGRRGVVVSQSRDAALAGVAILDAGGNAVDAAVATALALTAAEPWNSGLGGIGFAVVHRAGQSRADTIDFGPVAPAGLRPDAYPLTGANTQELFTWPGVVGDVNIHGPLSFTVPSAVAGYALLHERWGSLPLGELIAPALALAKRGLPMDWFTTLRIASAAATLRLYASSAAIYLPGGLPPIPPYQGTPGFLPLGGLPETLERLGRAGWRDFYEGEIAAALIEDCAKLGSFLTADDLRHCEARVRPALEVPWHDGRTIQLADGLTAGPTFARVLAAMHGETRRETPDAAWFAVLARAMKAAYSERLARLGAAESDAAVPGAAETCTSHISVCDGAGTAVAMTTTLLSSMGSRLVLPQTGVLMNNGVMWFDPRPGQPNSAAPGKRALSNMCPVVVRREGAPVLVAGASGGRRIMAAVAHVLAFTLDFGMDPAQAAHHPRIDVSDSGKVSADMRLPAEVVEALRADGPVEMVEHGVLPANFACPNMILWRGSERIGVSDAMSPWSAAVAQA